MTRTTLALGSVLLLAACSGGSSTPPVAKPAGPSTGAPSHSATVAAAPVPAEVIASPGANARNGDGTEYLVLISLKTGTKVSVVGVSSRGTGWLQVQLSGGGTAWVAPSVVQVDGAITGLPSVAPTAKPSAKSSGSLPDLVVKAIGTDRVPSCGVAFTATVQVTDIGSGPTAIAGAVSVIDTRAADGAAQGGGVVVLPVLTPGQTVTVKVPLTITTSPGELHTLTATVDPSGSVRESSKTNNAATSTYTPTAGSCG